MPRHALVVGIGQNLPPLGNLSKAVGDAEAIATVLETYGDYRVQRLIGNVNQRQLIDGLKLFLERVKDGGQGFLYYTGHGLPISDEVGKPKPWLIPSDCVVLVQDGKAIEQSNGLSFAGFSTLVQEAKAGELVILLDCCHSGYFLDRALVEETLKAFNSKSYFLITACQSYESGFARSAEAHNVFTGAVLEGLAEGRANDREVVTGDMLFAHVAERLRQQNQQLPDGGQQPVRLGIGDTIDLVKYGRQALAAVICEENPYQGLQAFTKETRQFFFGRDSVVNDLVLKLQGASFVPLFGASGSGKSSVVRAGLVPRLEAMGWQILGPMKPGPEPITELKRSFDAVFKRKQLGAIYQQIEAEGLKGIVAQLPAKQYLLVIDQFEEVFTLCEDRSKQRQFIELLMGLEVGDCLSIVTTMRSDFVETWQTHGDLVSVLQGDTVWMPPLEGNDLRDAIVKPAQVQGYEFGEGLESLILEHVAAEINALPLLEFALQQLWERRDQRQHRLTVAAYEEMGCLMGALNQHATNWYGRLTEEDQALVRRVMLELVRVGVDAKDTRWRRKLTEVSALGDQEIAKVVDLLSEQRLIVQDKDEIDLVHERLMDGWKLFAEWRQSDRDLRRLVQRMRDAWKDWMDKEKHDDYLWPRGLITDIREHWNIIETSQILSLNQKDYLYASEIHAYEQEYARIKANLRDQVQQVNLLRTSCPVDSILTTIQAVGRNLKRLPHLSPEIQGLLRQSLFPSEQLCIEVASQLMLFVQFSPDGETIIGVSEEGDIYLWNSLTGELKNQIFKGNLGKIEAVALSPDGQTLVLAHQDCNIYLWHISGAFIHKIIDGHSDSVASIAFSPNGNVIATASRDCSIRLWNKYGQSISQPFGNDNSGVYSVAFSPDGQTIVGGCGDNTIRLWNLSGCLINQLEPEYIEGEIYQGVNSVAFSPDGDKIVAATGSDIRLWDVKGDSISKSSLRHTLAARCVIFSSDNTAIISCSYDKFIRIWDLYGEPSEITLTGHSQGINTIAVSPDGQKIVSCSADKTIRVWNTTGCSVHGPILGHTSSIHSVAISPDGEKIASVGFDFCLGLWDSTGNPIGDMLDRRIATSSCVVFTPDSQICVTGGEGTPTIQYWDVHNHSSVKSLQGKSGWISSVAISPDGQIVVADNGNTIEIWNKNDEYALPSSSHRHNVLSICFSPDSRTIVTGSYDCTLMRWSICGDPIGEPLKGHIGPIRSVCYNSRGSLLASGSADGTVRLWTPEGNPIGEPLRGHSNGVKSVCFSPDGKMIASASDDKTIRLWDLDGNPIGEPLQGHSAAVSSICFSPDGRMLVSGSSDNTLRLWIAGNWEHWLRICCDRLRYHPALNDSNNPTAVEACEVCRKYVWEVEDN
jgi:WD40 repeat protein/energy-coupling factor transporter ATP-binding protein EcfA2